MNLLQIENKLIELNNERAETTKTYREFMERTQKQIDELNRNKEMAMNGVDLNKVSVAEKILEVRGLKYGQYNERCVLEAIKDIATGEDVMKKKYFGVKNYDRWTHQECDCEYGYGPSHGSIVFSVGYKRNIQTNLTDEEKENCIYYLTLLRNKNTRSVIAPNIAV